MTIRKINSTRYNRGVKQTIERELERETAPETINGRQIPQIEKTKSGKYKFQDGTREYNSPDSAMNAIKGFNKFRDKREEVAQFIHKKSYEELAENMTPEQTKEYDNSIKTKKTTIKQ